MKTKNLLNELLPVAIFGICVGICSWGCTLTSNGQGSGGATDSGGSTGAGGITTSGGVTGKGGQTSPGGSGGMGAGGSGGTTDSGGSTSAGGVTSVTGKGGQTSTGGVTGGGGVTGQGGQAGSGGVTGSGGVSSPGGRSGSGGATGPGDAAASGGAPGSGGATSTSTGVGGSTALKGPCDIYQQMDGKPCVAAHSTVRLLLSTYTGPLYQVRAGGSAAGSGGTTADIGFLPDGYANAAAQDTACGSNACTISIIYDQSGKGNHLTHTLAGGSAKAGADNEADAKALKITVGGHSVYGEHNPAGVGYRNNKPSGTATGDNPETEYMITSGDYMNGGCCFDYGNMETNTHDNGEGTMEAIYFGNCTIWGKGSGSGPWVMGDLENGLWAGNVSPYNGNTPVSFKYVTAILKGDAAGKNHWAIKAGNAQTGALTSMFDGVRPNSRYNPMRKEGAVALGTGGDNSNGAQGNFFEGIMTAHFSSDAADDAVQANIVAAGYGK